MTLLPAHAGVIKCLSLSGCGAWITKYKCKNKEFVKNVKYTIIIEYDVIDEIYVASVPQLRGCMAHRKTPEEALKQIKDAQCGWL